MVDYKIVEPSRERWNEFVNANPESNIFQTYDMKDVYDKTKNYKTLLLAVEKEGNIVAGTLIEIRKERGWPASYFATRAVIEGGPLYTEKEAISFLIKEIETRLKGKVIYIHIFNEGDTSDIKDIMLNSGYNYEDELNFLIDLDRNKEIIFSDIHKSRRKCINRAKNMNVLIKKVDKKEDLVKFYGLVKETYKRIRVPAAHYSLIESCFDVLGNKGMVDFYIAEFEGKTIGVRAIIKYKDIVYDWSAGSSEDNLDKYPNEALVWHILEENAGKYKIFDFQGAGKPGQNYGPGEFKRRFGGKEVNFGRFKKVLCPIRNKIAMIGLKLYQKVS